MYDAVLISAFSGFKTTGIYRLRTAAGSAGYSVKILEVPSIGDEILLKLLLRKFCSKQTMVIGFSTTWSGPTWEDSDANTLSSRMHKLNEWIKKVWPDMKIILGGASAAYIHSDLFDLRILSYADLTFIELLNCLRNDTSLNLAVHKIPYDPYKTPTILPSLNDINSIDMDSINTVWKKEDYIFPHHPLPIEIARGCIFKCAFCSFPLNGKKKFDYIRSVDRLVEEFQYNYETFGVTNYSFNDDTYNDSEFKLDLLDDVLAQLDFKIRFTTYIKPELLLTWPHHIQQMKEQGIEGSTCGVESLHSETRVAIKKSRDFDLMIEPLTQLNKVSGLQLNLIFGLPFETVEKSVEGLNFLLDNPGIASTIQIFGLRIQAYATNKANLSLIEMDPKKYGYELDLSTKKFWPFAPWKSKFATSTKIFKEVAIAKEKVNKINRIAGRDFSFMQYINAEHKPNILRYDLHKLYSEQIKLVHNDYAKFQLSL